MSLKRDFDSSAPLKKDAPFFGESRQGVRLFGTEEEQARLSDLLDRCAQSSVASGDMARAAEEGYMLAFSASPATTASCNGNSKCIFLGKRQDDNMLTYALCHEMAHARQMSDGFSENLEGENLKSRIVKIRLAEADAQRATVQACAELAEQGDEAPLIEFAECYPAVYEPFEDAYETYGALHDKAATAAFKGFYDCSYSKNYYEDLDVIGRLSFMAERGKLDGHSFDKDIEAASYVDLLCRKGNGENYFADDPQLLETGHYVAISPETKAFADDFMAEYEQKTGRPADQSLQDVPVEERDVPVRGGDESHRLASRTMFLANERDQKALDTSIRNYVLRGQSVRG